LSEPERDDVYSVTSVGYLFAHFCFCAHDILPIHIKFALALGGFLAQFLDLLLCILESKLGGLQIALMVARLFGVPLDGTLHLGELHRVHALSICLTDYLRDRDGSALVEHVGDDFVGSWFFDECCYRTRRFHFHLISNFGNAMVERAAENTGERE